MTVTFALHPAASKHLIAQAVTTMPEVKAAFNHGKIIIGAGTSNLEIASMLLNRSFEPKEDYIAGLIAEQVACITDPSVRKLWCIENGKLIDVDWVEFLYSFGKDDVFIKGANAVDPFGNVGILLANPVGGTIGKSIGTIKSRGINLICPVGLEKLIPSCIEAEKTMGIYKTPIRLGMQIGYMAVTNSNLVTEIQSLKMLFGVDASIIAAGGVTGMEGSVVLRAQCESEKQAEEILQLVKKANKIKPLKVVKRKCSECENPCFFNNR
ncbi:MAG TPA: hypothetical protein VFC73_04350 [Syntrophomonadaceae bacterium]|nr:hypothetical protein [Syntrophomonadaceae bacterium]